MSERLDARHYYDRFSRLYDRPRGRGYHAMIDTLQAELVLPLSIKKDVLEVGCGTGLMMERLKGNCRRLVGLDLSSGMLDHAHKRGLNVFQGAAQALPFAGSSFDVVYSFKVLAHVEQIRPALSEMSRVLRPGGRAVCDFYNPISLRGLIKALKPPTKVADDTADHQVYTRFDTPARFAEYLPADLRLVDTRGIRVLTPWAGLLNLPFMYRLMTGLERAASRAPILKGLGGFMVALLRKEG